MFGEMVVMAHVADGGIGCQPMHSQTCYLIANLCSLQVTKSEGICLDCDEQEQDPNFKLE